MAMSREVQDTMLNDYDSSHSLDVKKSQSSLIIPAAIVTVGGLGLYSIYRGRRKSKSKPLTKPQVSSGKDNNDGNESDQKTSDVESNRHHAQNDNNADSVHNINSGSPNDTDVSSSGSKESATQSGLGSSSSSSDSLDRTDKEAGGEDSPSSKSEVGSDSSNSDDAEDKPSERLSRITISRNHLLDLSTYNLSGDVNRDVNKVNELYNEYFSDMVDDISSIDMINRLKSFILDSPKYELVMHVLELLEDELALQCALSYQCGYGLYVGVDTMISPRILPVSKTKKTYEFSKQGRITSLTCSKDLSASNGIITVEPNSVTRINGRDLSLYLIFRPNQNTSITIKDMEINLIGGVYNFILLKGADSEDRQDIKEVCALANEYDQRVNGCIDRIDSIIESILANSYNFDQVVPIYPGSDELVTKYSMNDTKIYSYMKSVIDKYEVDYKATVDRGMVRHSSLPFIHWYTRAVFDRICQDTIKVYSQATVEQIQYTASQSTNRVAITLTNASNQPNYLACCRWVSKFYQYGAWSDYDVLGYTIFVGRTSRVKEKVYKKLGTYYTSRASVGAEYPQDVNQREVPFFSESELATVDFNRDGTIRFTGEASINTIDCEVAQCIDDGSDIVEAEGKFFIAVRLHKGDTISWHTGDGKYRSYKSDKLQDLVFPVFAEFFTGIIRDHNTDINAKLTSI